MSDADAITRLNAALEGRYRIVRKLGEGGMATVYLADDVKHERKVALKVLKQELAAVVGADRFLAEIKTTANLQHPHILPLFDSGDADGFLFYVMPYVEGESLRERLDREHQLPVDGAGAISSKVASALDYAHGHGVIHRDIKPANILLSETGEPLVSDFGIALAVSAGGGDRLTETGLSLGTPHYMSPEQATGDLNVGPQTDIYALGCVLYEMLVGEPPFTGSTPQAVLGKIVTGELPSVRQHRVAVPVNVDAAVRRALEKFPADRFETAARFSEAIKDPGFRYGEKERDIRSVERRWSAWTLLFATTSFVLAGVLFWVLGDPAPLDQPTMAWYSSPFEEGQEPTWWGPSAYAHSPDGSSLIYVRDGRLWERRWAMRHARPLAGTDGGQWPTITNDGNLAFEVDGEIRVTSLPDGPVVPWLEGSRPRWGPDGWLYAQADGGVVRVRQPGGDQQRLTDAGSDSWITDVLPTGDRALIEVGDSIGVLDLSTAETSVLGSGANAQYLATGHIVFTRSRALWALSYDASSGRNGPAEPVLQGTYGWTLSDTGRLFYATDDVFGPHTLVQVDRAGSWEELQPGWSHDSEPGGATVAISPDGRRLAVSVGAGSQIELYVIDLDSEARLFLTDRGFRVSWAGDHEILHVATRNGVRGLYAVPASGSGTPRLVLAGEDPRVQQGEFSPDGSLLAYRSGSTSSTEDDPDIFVMRWDVDTIGTVVPGGEGSDEMDPAISPDGRWLAYTSDRSGRREVYVVPLPDPASGPLLTVSLNGGSGPRWARAGDELFFRDSDGLMVAARYISTPSRFEVVERERLFPADLYLFEVGIHSYDVAPDGQSFVMFRPLSDIPYRRTHVIENWGRLVEARVPGVD